MMNTKSIVVSVFTVSSLLVTTAPAHALFGGPFTTAASALGYKACRDAAAIDGVITKKEAAACLLITLDPVVEGVTNIEGSISFDSTRFEIVPEPFFFGEFSESGEVFPLTLPVVGTVVPPLPYPDFNLNLALEPRQDSTYNFVVNNNTGIVDFSMDLSANPVPGILGPQNFFGVQLQLIGRKGTITGVEYFDTPGNYDVNITFSCTTNIQPPTCGSDTPITGFNIISTTTPETTSTLSLLTLGTLGAASTLKRKLNQKSTGKETTKVG